MISPQAFYRWESSLKEVQRGRPAELDDDVKANAMRHMVPKEILDAVDLQPQYRTFSEIRGYMLQQARQRADVNVGDVCHPTKKVGTITPRVNTNTSTPTATKATTPVPMDVSQMSSNVSKTETDEQENDSYQCEQDQECDGDEVFAVKDKGKGGFKGTCFKCGMRGHKADRCWQKGKGKRGKGDSEKRKGGSHVITSQSGSPRNFAHVNRFSMLVLDDDESPGKCCASKHTSRIQCQPRRCGDERVDECRRGDERVDQCSTAPETKFSSHRGSGTSKLNAHQVSYFAASGGDSKGVHHVSGSGWRRLSAIMDSGSAECVAPESIAI